MDNASSYLPSTPSADPASTPAPLSEPPTAFPAELVGTWTSSSGGAELVYEFARDGSYKYVGVLLQERPSGTFSFTVAERGAASAEDSDLTLRPSKATESLKDPDSPSSDYTDRPSSLAPKSLRWSLDAAGTVLRARR